MPAECCYRHFVPATEFCRATVEQDITYDPKQHRVLSLGLTAEVTDAWQTRDTQIVSHLDSFHPYTEDFAKSRLTLKGRQTITILLLRCKNPQAPLAASICRAYVWLLLLGESR